MIRFLSFLLMMASVFATKADESLRKLEEGNERFIKDESMLAYTKQAYRRNFLSECQAPFAVILGCSDSRVPPEILFDQGIGELFIIRVAGNVLGPSEIDSITYAVKVLGSPLIVVLGHENCGAVKAVWEGKAALIPFIKKEIFSNLDHKNSECTLTCQIKSNVTHIVEDIKKNSMFKDQVAEGSLKVMGAYYPFVSGKVEFIK